jgi:putative ABC transport system substrate-binding protein
VNRRKFIAGLGAGAACWPFVGRAQQLKIPRLGVLLYTSPQGDPSLESLKRGLAELSYVDGRSVAIEYRSAERRPERLPGLARELAALKPDVIVALGGDVAPFAKAATQDIPIVFASSSDPVQGGLAASLGRPGGNATGVTFLLDDLAAKRLELFKEAAPQIASVAFFANPDHLDNEHDAAKRAAQALGIGLQGYDVRNSAELPAALKAAADARCDALYVVSSRLMVANIPAFVDFAAKSGAPLVGGWGAWAKAGALMSYGPNVNDLVARAAAHVDKILKGAKAAELPIEQPTKFDLVVNLKAAKTLGLKISEGFLLRADEVIE